MRESVRFTILVGALLVFQILFRGLDFFIGRYRRTADWIEPVREEIVGLFISLLPEYIDFSIHYIEPVGTVILYLAVFAGLIRAVYPEKLWIVLSEAEITRLFRFVISLHTVALFLTWKVYNQMQGELGLMFFFDTWNGYPISVWFLMFGSLYFGIFAPVSVGLLLSVPHAGMFSLPERDSDALEFTQGFTAEVVDLGEDIDSAPIFWTNQGVYHVLPAYVLGVLFIIFDAIFPTVELLLAIGIVASLSPWRLFPPGDVGQYDLEQRLAQMLRAATANIKGLIASTYIVGGLLLGVWVLTALFSSLILFPRPQPTGLFAWNLVGLICSLIVYTSISTLLWLSLADRLPWFINAWTEDYTTFKGRNIAQDDKLPSRFEARLTLPIIWVVLSLSLAYSIYDLAQLVYAILWPIFLVVILSYFTGYESAPMARSDNKVIIHSIVLQSMASVIVILADFDSSSVLGFIPTSGTHIFMIMLVGMLTTFLYFLPEKAHNINQNNNNVSLSYDNSNSNDDIVTSGKSGKQRKSRILSLYGSCMVFATLAAFLMTSTMDYVFIGLPYLLTGGWIFLGWVYRTDPEKLREGNEVDITTELRVAILLLLFIAGLGVTLYADPVATRFINPLFIIVPSLILAIIFGIQFIYEKHFNN